MSLAGSTRTRGSWNQHHAPFQITDDAQVVARGDHDGMGWHIQHAGATQRAQPQIFLSQRLADQITAQRTFDVINHQAGIAGHECAGQALLGFGIVMAQAQDGSTSARGDFHTAAFCRCRDSGR